MAIVTGKKRKRVSKKNKISWRKHAKVADIETFLEEQRDEERLGAPLESVPNEALFVIDTKPDKSQLFSRNERKVRARRPLRGFTALEPHTGVPDPIKKRNRVRTPEERKSEFVKGKTDLKAKEIEAVAERRLDEIRREKNRLKLGDYSEDIWQENEKRAIENDPWAKPVTKVHNLRNTGIPVKRVVNDLAKKKSVLPAVEIPHPGTSYNPSFKDHQDLLNIVASEEIKVIKQEEHIKRVTSDMFRKVSPDQKDTEWIVEMTDTKQEPEDEADLDLDRISVNPPVRNKKKTLQQRRKQREQLQEEKLRRTRKMEKKKIGDIHTIKLLQKELEKNEKKQQKLREIRKIRAEKAKTKPKVLSATKFEDPGPDFQLGRDIVGNLRSIKKEGNLLADRFVSMQKRNILEPRKRALRKKPKVKKYTKPGHKEDWEKSISKLKT